MFAENAVRQSLSAPICENPTVSADAADTVSNAAATKLRMRTMSKILFFPGGARPGGHDIRLSDLVDPPAALPFNLAAKN